MARLSGRLDPQREVERSGLAILSRRTSALEIEGLTDWGSIREDAGCTAGPFEVVYNSVSSEMMQREVKQGIPERFKPAKLSLTIQRSIVKAVNDAVRNAKIQPRIVESRRQEDAVEWLQGDAFRTLVDKLFAQLT